MKVSGWKQAGPGSTFGYSVCAWFYRMIALLYALSMAVLLIYGLNLLWMAMQHARQQKRPDALPPPDGAETAALPCVTVQLPLYNERHVATRLIDACAALDYPRDKLEIQVLDDSTDDTFGIVAAHVERLQQMGHDIQHVYRSNRTGYKAGALQHGLHLARGSHIAIFDADFIPPPDFLRRALPAFDAPGIGLVQARWGHLNPTYSLLTRMQAFGLDAHFALEQQVRSGEGLFMNFNGTAGVWRRDCIDDAGGWKADTLTEDLDLSYRAQMKGWRFRYLNTLEVPAELPVEMQALRQQQFRWTKGAAETVRKLLLPFLRTRLPLWVKVQGGLHLTAHVVFPFVLLAVMLHPLLVYQRWVGEGPGDVYFAFVSLGVVGFAGLLLAHVAAQRHLYADWAWRMLLFPVFMAGTTALAFNNTLAIAQAIAGRRTAFERTPKYCVEAQPTAWWKSGYAARRLSSVVWGEAALALYSWGGLALVVYAQAWVAVPFQLLFATGFSLVTFWNVQQRFGRRR